MSVKKPLYVVHEQGVTPEHMQAVLAGVNEIVHLAGAEQLVEVRNFGHWRQPGYCTDGVLQAYQSVDWYVAMGRREGRPNQINGSTIARCLVDEPWQQAEPHYDLTVLHSDMYAGNTRFVLGMASPGLGTILSVNRCLQLEPRMQAECIKSETIHELGHVFGLIPIQRTTNVERSLGRHCTNRCIMRQGLTVPDDWVRFTRDRLTGPTFCQECLDALRQYFR